MIYARIENGIAVEFPLTEKQVRAAISASLPKQLTDEMLMPLGYAMVGPGKPEDFPQQTKDMVAVLSSIEWKDVEWVRHYTLQPVPDDVMPEDEDPATWVGDKQARVNRKWKSVRSKRDRLMNEFEWRVNRFNRETALGLTPKDDGIVLQTYMQALADITLADDPFLVQFPIVP